MSNIVFRFIPFKFLHKIVVPNGQTCLEACLTSTDALTYYTTNFFSHNESHAWQP